MLNLIVFLSACGGLICGVSAWGMTRDPGLGAVVGVMCALGFLFLGAGVVLRLIDAVNHEFWPRRLRERLAKLGFIRMPCNHWHEQPNFYACGFPCPACGKRVNQVEKLQWPR